MCKSKEDISDTLSSLSSLQYEISIPLSISYAFSILSSLLAAEDIYDPDVFLIDFLSGEVGLDYYAVRFKESDSSNSLSFDRNADED